MTYKLKKPKMDSLHKKDIQKDEQKKNLQIDFSIQVFGLSELEILIICLLVISWFVVCIYIIADIIVSLIECKKCGRKKHCVREKIKELNSCL